jgi:hypothetical protein
MRGLEQLVGSLRLDHQHYTPRINSRFANTSPPRPLLFYLFPHSLRYKAGKPEKNCAWVRADASSRCVEISDDGTFAFESCPHSCGECGCQGNSWLGIQVPNLRCAFSLNVAPPKSTLPQTRLNGGTKARAQRTALGWPRRYFSWHANPLSKIFGQQMIPPFSHRHSPAMHPHIPTRHAHAKA